jgi:RNA polymerase sigma-70 factor (ECF subfamily)
MAKGAKLFGFSSVAHPVGDDGRSLMLKVRDRDDRNAFGALYERFKGPIMSYIAQMTRNPCTAEELTQEVFLRIYRARETYEPQAKFSTWLWSIARNATIDHLRKKKELSDEGHVFEEGEEATSRVEELASSTPDAEALLVEHADRASLEDCLSKLSDPQRETLNLRISGELSYEEIAETLKIKVPAVKSLLHRARLALSECLKRKSQGVARE